MLTQVDELNLTCGLELCDLKFAGSNPVALTVI